jgi:hypothetical protein
LLDDVLRPSGKKAARLYRVLNRRQFDRADQLRVAYRRDLLVNRSPSSRPVPRWGRCSGIRAPDRVRQASHRIACNESARRPDF